MSAEVDRWLLRRERGSLSSDDGLAMAGVRKKRALPDGLANGSYPTLCSVCGTGKRAPLADIDQFLRDKDGSARRNIEPLQWRVGIQARRNVHFGKHVWCGPGHVLDRP